MLARKKKVSEINLLPIDAFNASTIGKILKWMLSTFRYIVIIIEMVVMGAFLSRFWLDAKNSDLNDEIRQKQALVEASKSFEDDFNKVREKVDILKILTQRESNINLALTEIPPLIPQEIKLTTVTIAPDTINITGTSPSVDFLSQFHAGLMSKENMQKAVFTQIQTAEESGLINFKLSIPTNIVKK